MLLQATAFRPVHLLRLHLEAQRHQAAHQAPTPTEPKLSWAHTAAAPNPRQRPNCIMAAELTSRASRVSCSAMSCAGGVPLGSAVPGGGGSGGGGGGSSR